MSGWTGPSLVTGSPRKEVSCPDGPGGLKLLRKPLSPRERDVLLAASRGLGTVATGRYLGIAPETVKTHRENVLRKLRVHTMAAACSPALRERWIS